MTATILHRLYPAKATVAVVLLAMGCLAGVDDTEFHEVRLVDSDTNPTYLGPLALNQIGSGKLSPPSRAWGAFEIAAPAGAYEARAWGEKQGGGDLDTTLYVYGPKTDGYPRFPMSWNDDAAGSGKGASALRVNLVDGTYRIIVSPYRRASSGTFHVVICPVAECATVQVPDLPRAPG